MTNNGRQAMTGDQLAALVMGTFNEHRGGDITAMQSEKQPEKDQPELEPSVDQKIQGHIGRKLRAVYDEMVQQPVPEKFRQLLEELERREKSE